MYFPLCHVLGVRLVAARCPHLPAAFPLPFRGRAMGGSSWSHGVGPAASVLMGTPGRLLALSSVSLAAPPEALRSLLGYNWWSDAGAERVYGRRGGSWAARAASGDALGSFLAVARGRVAEQRGQLVTSIPAAFPAMGLFTNASASIWFPWIE